MNRSATQFWVAILATVLVGAVVFLMVWGAIFRDVNMGTAMAAFSGLTGVSGAAASWLFRIENGDRIPHKSPAGE